MKTKFEQALCVIPICLVGGFDPGRDQTLDDLIALAEHELNLHAEGEETDIKDKRDVQEVTTFIKRVRVLKEHP